MIQQGESNEHNSYYSMQAVSTLFIMLQAQLPSTLMSMRLQDIVPNRQVTTPIIIY